MMERPDVERISDRVHERKVSLLLCEWIEELELAIADSRGDEMVCDECRLRKCECDVTMDEKREGLQ